MAVNVPRLRVWFAAAAIGLLALVAGFYFYGRWRMRRAINEAPKQLGINIQQSTEGFTFSKSEGGRTIFTVHATRAVQYKQSGRAELRDVNIIVYGRQSNRFDQIYGSDFEYDPRSGNISANGEVHIDLEGNAKGPRSPDQAPPEELKNPIHLKTSGLVFNQKTGLARTREKIEFRVPQASGSALGASYDSRAATLTLEANIQVHVNQPNEADITARHGEITKGPNRALLQEVRMERPTGNFAADQLTLFFRDDNTIDHLTASGNVRAETRGRSSVQADAARAEAWIGSKNELRSVAFSGGVRLNSIGEQNVAGTAGRVVLALTARHRLDKIAASEGVRLLQRPVARNGIPAHPVEISAPGMDFLIKNGRLLAQATTSGPAQVMVLPIENASSGANALRTVATAGRFDARFQHNRLASVSGSPEARVVTSASGQTEKISTSQSISVSFAPAGAIAGLLQEGNFHYLEEPPPPAPRREAWAQRAQFVAGTDALTLTGAPRIVEGGMTTTAKTIRVGRASADIAAQGDVKTTYSELKPQPGGALLATGDPIHVTARNMSAQRATGMARYFDARLWQGANIVQAPEIDFQREPRRVEARGENGRRITTVFVEQDKNGKLTPLNVTAARLSYADAQRQARFEGGVVVRGADTVLAAERVDVFLQARTQNQSAAAPGAPSQVERLVAGGGVTIQQPNRRATGEKLVYTVAEGKFVLTGGLPSIFDAEHGKITGDSLTFFNRDDRVLVESKNSSPTVTQTRIAK